MAPAHDRAEPNDLKSAFERSAARFADRVAIDHESGPITFARLNEEANRLAHALVARFSLAKGDRVALLLKNSPEFLIATYGVLKACATLVPLNFLLKPEEVRYVLADARCRAVITSGEFSNTVVSAAHDAPCVRSVVFMDDAAGDGRLTWPRRQLVHDAPVSNPPVAPEPGDVAVFMYTSGTTGIPKAAMLTHRNFVANVESCRRHVAVSADDCFLLALPLFHSFSLTVNGFLPMSMGCRVVLLESFVPFEKVLDAIVRRDPTIFAAVPSVFGVLARKEIPAPVAQAVKLRVCISGSAPLAEATLRAFEERCPVPLLEGYGLSEAAPVVSLNPLDGVRKVGSIGLPLPDVEVAVFDEDDHEVPRGEPGELVVRGPNVMLGYHNQPEETAAALRHGWLHTGDIARIDEDGYIFILDRKKELIISKGLKIYPRQIEELLYAHPKVAEAAVIGRPDEHRDETPVAYVALRDGEEATSRELIDYVRARVAPYKVPREVVFVKEFPRTATGKILKRALRQT